MNYRVPQNSFGGLGGLLSGLMARPMERRQRPLDGNYVGPPPPWVKPTGGIDSIAHDMPGGSYGSLFGGGGFNPGGFQQASYSAPDHGRDDYGERREPSYDYQPVELAALEKQKRGEELTWSEREVLRNMYERAPQDTKMYLQTVGGDQYISDNDRERMRLENELRAIEAMPDGPEKERRLQQLQDDIGAARERRGV